jgi:hypothetical protein
MMRKLQPALRESAPDRLAGLWHLPEHGTRAQVPPHGGNLFAM